MQTVVSSSLSTAGVGYTTAMMTTAGGGQVAGAIANSPEASFLAWLPRPANIVYGASVSAGTPATVYDGGLFLWAPTFVQIPTPFPAAGAFTLATPTNVMGSKFDIAIIQPGP